MEHTRLGDTDPDTCAGHSPEHCHTQLRTDMVHSYLENTQPRDCSGHNNNLENS